MSNTLGRGLLIEMADITGALLDTPGSPAPLTPNGRASPFFQDDDQMTSFLTPSSSSHQPIPPDNGRGESVHRPSSPAGFLTASSRPSLPQRIFNRVFGSGSRHDPHVGNMPASSSSAPLFNPSGGMGGGSSVPSTRPFSTSGVGSGSTLHSAPDSVLSSSETPTNTSPVGFGSSSIQSSLSQRIQNFFSGSSTGNSSSQDSHIGSMSSSNPAFAGVKGGAKGSFILGPKAQMAGLGIMQAVGLIQGALGIVNQNQAQKNASEMQAWQNNESKLMQGRQMSQVQDQEQQSFANIIINARQRYRW